MRNVAPIRTCVGCGKRDSQSQLLRFSLSEDGALVAGSSRGRGGYLHRRPACMHAFTKARSGFVRSLRAVVPREIRIRYLAHIERSATLSS
ncbi:MAG: YlxR family protein [Deltaproteobacteria bacterium]|nr:YlxR family protein [Deltaproteobacteria bacterium]